MMESVKQGYLPNVNNNDYHNDVNYLSSSQLKKAHESYATFNYYLEHGEATESKMNGPMDFGSLIHCLLLEPHMLNDEFAFIDTMGMNLRTKADKAILHQFCKENAGKIVMSKHRLEEAKDAARSALTHDFLRELLEADGEAELSGYFTDPNSGLNMRTRPDRKIYGDKRSILDIKTTSKIKGFANTAKWDLKYMLSAHMYLHADKVITGDLSDMPFYFGVIESVPPYRTAVYKASEASLRLGENQFNVAVENVLKAKAMPVESNRYQQEKFEEI